MLTGRWQAALGRQPGPFGLGQAFIMSNFGFPFEELYFRLIFKGWKIHIGIQPRKKIKRLQDDLIPVALIRRSVFLF